MLREVTAGSLSRFLGMALWVCWIGAGCSANQTALRPGLVEASRPQELGANLLLEVDAGPFPQGTAIGEGAGDRLNLGQAIDKIIEKDLTKAWSLDPSVFGTADEADPRHRVVLRLEEVSVNWPSGIPIIKPSATVVARVKLSAQVFGADPGTEPGYSREYLGEASDEFSDYRYVGEGWLELFNTAYTRCMGQLIDDGKLVALLRGQASSALAKKKANASVVVAVFDIQDPAKAFQETVMRQLTDFFTVQVTEVVGYRVVPREQLADKIAESKRGSYSDRFDQGYQVELGKAMAAQKIINAKVHQMGKKCVLSATLFDMKTETADQAVTQDAGCSVDLLMKGLKQLAEKLAAL